MTKKLPIVSPPDIIGYLMHAYRLAIIANSEYYQPWLHSNYIQLKCLPKFYETKDKKLDFEISYLDNPLLAEEYAYRDSEDFNQQAIIPFIIDGINQGYYIHTYVDEFYVPESGAYQKVHFAHNMLLCGYHLSQRIFHYVGFNKVGSFGEWTISFADFEEAHVYREMYQDIYKAYMNKITKYRLKPDGYFEFDVHAVIQKLNDYLNPQPSDGLDTSLVYGLHVYDRLLAAVDAVTEQAAAYDIRPIHLMWEHKKCMLERLRFLEKNAYLNHVYSESYTQIEQQIHSLRHMLLKFGFNQDTRLLQTFRTTLPQICRQEELILNHVLEDLLVVNRPAPTLPS